ncbi:HutD-family protein [Streptomyces sp. WM6372]|uniref:HutD/Ves family protein n=1 Tax=Streptomyces sp. WM6372 TaxID=1415555 RepID=UPI0006AD9587|nr:HutD family protein [Streptomyces sp. WM6372]KOU25395.1 HutD-family protein [Streptomyces sp. WM6372]
MAGGNEIRILRAGDRAAVAWKNAGGVTREIAAWPEGAGLADFGWRISLAEVAADGPFSGFPGVDRTLTLAEGAGMDLTVAGARRLVDERYAPQDFPGDAPTDCRLLDGPVVNFNVMYRRDRVRARTAVVRGTLALTTEPGETLLVVALLGPAELQAGTGLVAGTEREGGTEREAGPGLEAGTGPGTASGPVVLGPYDAVRISGAGTWSLGTRGHAAVVRLAARPGR